MAVHLLSKIIVGATPAEQSSEPQKPSAELSHEISLTIVLHWEQENARVSRLPGPIPVLPSSIAFVRRASACSISLYDCYRTDPTPNRCSLPAPASTAP